MRLLVIADARPDFPLDAAAADGLDAVICLGDLDVWVLRDAVQLGVPVLGVHGNHDSPGAFEQLGITDLHLARVELGGLVFGGLEGSPRYKPGPYQYEEHEFAAMLAGYAPVDVLCCHSPPRGVNDNPGHSAHRGSPALREWVLANQPLLLLHGHTYPDRIQTSFGATHVRYVRGGAVLQLGA